MGKKTSLKSALSSQQSRLKKKQDALHAAQVAVAGQKGKQPAARGGQAEKGKGKATRPAPAVVPFKPTDTILLIGEGNFSFAHALVFDPPPSLQYLPPASVVATAYDSEEECFSKYPEAREIVQSLRAKGVEVLFSVDATKLEKHHTLKHRKFDKAIWNFPHAGKQLIRALYAVFSIECVLGKGIADQDRNILSNQVLLLAFLRSVAYVLRTGPVPVVQSSRKRKANDDSDDEREASADETAPSKAVQHRGTVLITLRNVPPYTSWYGLWHGEMDAQD